VSQYNTMKLDDEIRLDINETLQDLTKILDLGIPYRKLTLNNIY